jgi:hypothetical protein
VEEENCEELVRERGGEGQVGRWVAEESLSLRKGPRLKGTSETPVTGTMGIRSAERRLRCG